ncbi:MAG: DUF3052 family protein [Acidimicrobiia bacterium]|nr:DUF3052 family protein [Acidimicrobiia bacterium]
MAGYSATPLAKKLGIKDGSRVALLCAPRTFDPAALEPLPDDARVVTGATKDPCDVILSFHTERADLEARVPALLDALDVDGGLWIAWPKRASKVPTDITEDTLREVWLPLGLVDNKVCAIDDVWSGLRLVWRREHRDAVRAGRRPG